MKGWVHTLHRGSQGARGGCFRFMDIRFTPLPWSPLCKCNWEIMSTSSFPNKERSAFLRDRYETVRNKNLQLQWCYQQIEPRRYIYCSGFPPWDPRCWGRDRTGARADLRPSKKLVLMIHHRCKTSTISWFKIIFRICSLLIQLYSWFESA